jgi:hypothetical protein
MHLISFSINLIVILSVHEDQIYNPNTVTVDLHVLTRESYVSVQSGDTLRVY